MHRLSFADLMIFTSIVVIIVLSIQRPRRPPRFPKHPIPAHEPMDLILRIKRRGAELFHF